MARAAALPTTQASTRANGSVGDAVAEELSAVRPGRERQLLTIALMLAMGVVALEGTVVTTALPTVVGELHGLTLYPWVFSVYLLASTTTVPIYGKLSDLYGRKPVFVIGLLLFLLGTTLCGFSGSMAQLVFFRAVQGLGAGAVQPLTLTVLSDIYTLQERPKIQPLTSSVWGVLSLAGPVAGAFITEFLSWRWVFWANVPLCLLALALLWRFLRERVAHRQVAVDYAGAATLSLALIAVLVVALEGGHSFAWASWPAAALLGGAAALFALFAFVERRAPDPVLPFHAFRLRIVAVSNAGNVLMGVALYGLTSYVPLFAQGVRGEPATSASAVLTPLLLGWSLSAMGSGRLYLRAGFRTTALLGAILIALGTAPLMLVTASTPLLFASAAMGITGIGLGIVSPAYLLGPQSAVPWNLRGAVTSSIQFCRTIAGAVGVALLGALLNARLAAADLGPSAPAGQSAESLVSAMLNLADRAALPPDVVRALSLAMAEGLHRIYFALFVMAAIGVAQVLLFSPAEAPRAPSAGGTTPPAENSYERRDVALASASPAASDAK